jgi:DnaJ-class molecular chaperone
MTLLLVFCETCQGEGRILTNDGGPDDTDHGKCPDCRGLGQRVVHAKPVTLEDVSVKMGEDDGKKQ